MTSKTRILRYWDSMRNHDYLYGAGGRAAIGIDRRADDDRPFLEWRPERQGMLGRLRRQSVVQVMLDEESFDRLAEAVRRIEVRRDEVSEWKLARRAAAAARESEADQDGPVDARSGA